ncbi:MAG TPA: NADH-quinone oxidoreductase subunit I [Candidatus Binataceae bacterium]|nr:NADH-quinone oxidoreductase subunit I [Candidatus Binataceae bacterium]
MGVAAYFEHFKEALITIFDGMAVTASHMIRKPYTIQYPDRIPVRVQDLLPFRYRGILDVDMEICTGCLACDRACPIDCIAIAIEKNAQTREILISQFDIDIAKCMFCGLCSEPCPTGAIHHTTEFEGADYSLESLIRRFIAEPVVAYKPKKGPEPDLDLARLLERGMKYVDEWAQPGTDKPPAASAASPKPAAPARTPAGPRTPVKPGAAATTKPTAPVPSVAKPEVAENAADAAPAETPSRPSPTAKGNASAIPSAANDAPLEIGNEPNEGAGTSGEKNSSQS